MTNKPKKKGTAFETACVSWLRKRLDDGRIDRRALKGAHDMGDLYGIWAHGLRGIAECKDYADWGDAELFKWQHETVNEKGNADADFALLIVHRKGCGESRFGRNHCYMTVGDVMRASGNVMAAVDVGTRATWVCMALEDACRLIEGSQVEQA